MLRGAIAGAVGGLVAAWVMERFQNAWTRTTKQLERQRVLTREDAGRRRGAKGGPEDPALAELPRDEGQQEEPATVKIATAVAEPVLERELTEEEKPLAGEAVHFGFGTFNGIVYGTLAEVAPIVKLGGGTAFGAAVWLLADELMLWKIGVAKRPTEYPPSTHAYALSAHLVYGTALEIVRRIVRALI